jgi:hypothetical protein
MKNYTKVYMRKAQLLFDITLDLFSQYQLQLDTVYKNYNELEDSILPWKDVISKMSVDFNQVE